MEIFSQGEADSEELWATPILRGFQTSFFFQRHSGHCRF